MDSLLNVPPGDLIIWFVVFLFACALHESAHAWTSDWFGDPTARYQGRITLNPIPHIDPIGTILIPLMGFLNGANVSLFGWAKATPVNPMLWREKTKANIMVSAAGPISNFSLALIALLSIKALLVAGVVRQAYIGNGGPFNLIVPTNAGGLMEPIATLLSILVILNITLGVFNLFPIPPLDGSHVLESLLPYDMAKAYEAIRPYGFILLLAFVWTPIPGMVLRPIFRGVRMLLFSN